MLVNCQITELQTSRIGLSPNPLSSLHFGMYFQYFSVFFLGYFASCQKDKEDIDGETMVTKAPNLDSRDFTNHEERRPKGPKVQNRQKWMNKYKQIRNDGEIHEKQV